MLLFKTCKRCNKNILFWKIYSFSGRTLCKNCYNITLREEKQKQELKIKKGKEQEKRKQLQKAKLRRKKSYEILREELQKEKDKQYEKKKMG